MFCRISCGAPWRPRRVSSCLRGWRIRCCRFHVLRQDAAGLPRPSRPRRPGPIACPMTCATAWRQPWRRIGTGMRPSPWPRSSAGSGRRPARLLAAFPIDRRELADHAALGLTEARVRGAIRTLEEVGFLDRAVASGSTHRPTPDGLHRKPVLFLFGSDYGPLFSAANRRAAAARERRSGSRRGPAPAAARRPSAGLPAARLTNSPKSKSSEADKVIMGEIRTALADLPAPATPLPAFEAALNRFKKAFEEGRPR